MKEQETGLPEGWVSTTLGQLVSIERGSSPRPIKSYLTTDNDGVNWVKIGDTSTESKYVTQTAEKITKEGAKKSRAVFIGDLILSNSMSLGRPYIMAIDGYIHDGWFVLRLPENVSTDFLYYLLSSSDIQSQFTNLAVGGVVQNIRSELVKQAKINLPPLPEQQHLSQKLTALLDGVAEAKQRLEKIPALLKQFRQSVLADAVSGKLTEEWRGTDELVNWKLLNLESLLVSSMNGLSKRKGEDGNEVVILRLADFKDGVRQFGNERKIKLTDKELAKYALAENDILVIRVNGSVDLAGLFICYNKMNEDEGFCDHFIRLKLDNKTIHPKFLTFISNNGKGRDYLKSCLSTSAGQNTINQSSIKGLKINLPPLEEQTQIIQKVETYFALADKIETDAANALEKVNLLTQSILAKAFRGELSADWRAGNGV